MLVKKRDFRRISNLREVKKVFIIATEGEKTEPKYFNDMKYFYRNSVIHVEVLKRLDSASSPQHIIGQLNQFKSNFDLENHDELWLLIDRDNWGDAKLSDIAAQCSQKKYHLALSNPCFEVWLLLHLKDITKYPKTKIIAFEGNKNKELDKEIRRICGSYNKSKLNTKNFLPNMENAIDRAKKLDIEPDHRWPNTIGTRVYKLAEKII